jgi:hypothetical protein
MQALHSKHFGPHQAPCLTNNRRQHRQQSQQHSTPQLLHLRSAALATCCSAHQYASTHKISWDHSHSPQQPHRLSIVAAAGNNQQQTRQQQQKDPAKPQQQQQQQQQQSHLKATSSKVGPADAQEDEDEGEWDSDDEYEGMVHV